MLLALYACNIQDVEPVENGETEIRVIDIPNGFDYRTHESVQITIADNSAYAKYDVFAYSDEYYLGNQTFENPEGEMMNEDVFKEDVINKPIFTGAPKDGVLVQTVSLPKYCNKVYIRRNESLNFSAELVDVIGGEVNYTFTGTSRAALSRTNVADYLFCVNGSAELFQVDPLNGDLTMLSEMPMGSYTAAIDQDNLVMYSIGRSNPYPLMKYDIQNDEWSTMANLGFGGPRLDFNTEDKLLYFSNKDYLRSIDPVSGAVLNEWDINGIHNDNGGDIAFAQDGTLFLASFSGLYRCDFDSATNEYNAVRISADNLPFMPTSMTIDSNQELWLANSASSSDLIIMDTVTGGWQYQYGINAGNNTDFGRTINDLTTLKVYSDTPDDTDTDNDGIPDSDDDFPEDPDKAFEVFTPSKYGTGTIAFEDLWPSYGDYDFNDVALNYRAIAILNADNLAVQVDFICNVKANGAGFTNGLGIEIEGVSSSQVESVTGPVYTQGYINLNPNGTEANQDNAVVIFTDDQDNFLNETTVSIKFTEPISTTVLGAAPFNPFIIINKDRDKEVHLPYRSLTNLGTGVSFAEGVNSDPDGNFISDNGYPWAISVIHDFKVPKERVPVDEAYNFFATWATSGGLEYNDWYKDNPGYRNNSKIDN